MYHARVTIQNHVLVAETTIFCRYEKKESKKKVTSCTVAIR